MQHASHNPASGDFIVEFAGNDEGWLNRALDRAADAFRFDWRKRSATERARLVHEAARLMRERRDSLAGYLTLEMGKLKGEALAEVDWAADMLDCQARTAHTGGRNIGSEQDAVRSQHVPLGTVLCVEAWNFPFYLAARVVAPNLVCGNTVLMVLSHHIPLTAIALERVFRDAGFPLGVYTAGLLPPSLVDKAAGDSRVQAVALNGVARRAAVRATSAGKPVQVTVLEPGGDDFFIVLDDADVEEAVALAVQGRMRNCGQMCTGAKRFLVQTSVSQTFVARLAAAMAAHKPGDPTLASTRMGPLATFSQLSRALTLVDRTVQAGAQLVTGGQRPDRPGWYIEPTVLAGVTTDYPGFHVDYLAPVAMITDIGSDADAISIVNSAVDMRGAVIVTRDPARAAGIVARIERGHIFVNETIVSAFDNNVPISGRLHGRGLSDLPVSGFVGRRAVHPAR